MRLIKPTPHHDYAIKSGSSFFIRPFLRFSPHFTIFRTLMPTLPPYLRLPLLQQHARSGFNFYRGREEAVHYDITIVYDDLL